MARRVKRVDIINFPAEPTSEDPGGCAEDSIPGKLAKYHRARGWRLGDDVSVQWHRAERLSRNESIYLRVVGFRESMHDDYEPTTLLQY